MEDSAGSWPCLAAHNLSRLRAVWGRCRHSDCWRAAAQIKVELVRLRRLLDDRNRRRSGPTFFRHHRPQYGGSGLSTLIPHTPNVRFDSGTHVPAICGNSKSLARGSGVEIKRTSGNQEQGKMDANCMKTRSLIRWIGSKGSADDWPGRRNTSARPSSRHTVRRRPAATATPTPRPCPRQAESRARRRRPAGMTI